ncbi:MAG: T9SS type A sorting domain-containing protein [Crocinitomicaceae bacterium]
MIQKILILFLCLSGPLRSQTILDEFSIDYSQGNVLLAWTIKSGSVCNGIQIYRGTDSLSFQLIENIDGVCGDLASSVSYTFTDHEPINNKTNYYKLGLGSQESEVIGIEVISIPSNSYLLRPNPVSGKSDLYFDNSNNHEVHLRIFDDFGSVIFKDQTNSNRFILDSTHVSSGMYYFTLENKQNNNVINGRVLFQD